MRGALIAFAVALIVAAGWFGRACLGGHFLVDHTRMIDTYHLATIYARYGAYIADGVFPWWFPEFALGVPVPSLSMYGLLYPPTLLYAVLPVETAWAWLAALHIALGAFGMFGFLSEETRDAVASASGAVLFAASGFVMSKVLTGHTNIVFPLMWAPVILWQVARCRRGAPGGAVALSAALALGLLSGHIQTWFYCGPAVLLYALLRLRDPADGAVPMRRYAAALGLGLVVAAGVTAAQWVPALDLTRMGAAPEVDASLVALWSPRTHAMAASAVPGFVGRLGHDYWGGETYPNELVGVSGFAFVLLGALALRCGDWRRDLRGWAWLVVAVLGLAIAHGPHSAIGRGLNDLPVLAWARTPGRAQMLTLLAGSVLAGHGVARWRGLDAADWRRPAIVAAAATAIAGVVAAVLLRSWMSDLAPGAADPEAQRTWASVWSDVAGPAVLREIVVVLAVGGALYAVRRGGRAAWALPAVLLGAALGGGLPRAETADSAFFHHDWAAELPAEARQHRYVLMDWRWPPLEIHGAQTTRRMSHVEPPWFRMLLDSDQQSRLWPWMDVGVLFERQARTSPATTSAGKGVLARGAPLPPRGRVQWFGSARGGVPDAEALTMMVVGGNELLLADDPEPPAGGDGGAGGTPLAEIESTTNTNPNVVAIEVRAPRPGWLLLADKYYPGWTATLDGEPVTISRANVAFRAVAVPPGTHRIEMRYEPAAIAAAVPISAVSLLVLAGWGGLVLIRSRRRQEEEASA